MTFLSLLTSVLVGVLAGLFGHPFAAAREAVPRWLPVAVGVSAAAVGTLAAAAVDANRTGSLLVDVAAQGFFAGIGVTAMVLTIGRKAGKEQRWHPPG